MPADLDALPAALTTEQAAALLGCARGTLWYAARDYGGIVDARGTVIVRPFKVQRALRWPREQLLELLRPIGGSDRVLAEVVPLAPQRPSLVSNSSGKADGAG